MWKRRFHQVVTPGLPVHPATTERAPFSLASLTPPQRPGDDTCPRFYGSTATGGRVPGALPKPPPSPHNDGIREIVRLGAGTAVATRASGWAVAARCPWQRRRSGRRRVLDVDFPFTAQKLGRQAYGGVRFSHAGEVGPGLPLPTRPAGTKAAGGGRRRGSADWGKEPGGGASRDCGRVGEACNEGVRAAAPPAAVANGEDVP